MYGYNNYGNYGNIPGQNTNIPIQNMNIPRTNISPDERIWVQNETSAEAYLLAPGGFARLWDSSTNRFYEKRADATGRPLPMEVYEYTRVLPQNEVLNSNADKIPMEEINARFDEITSRIDALEKVKKVTKNAKQSDADDSGV